FDWCVQYRMAGHKAGSAATIAMDLEITPGLKIPEVELRLSFARSGGPGGQNVNKVSSKAVLHFDVVASPSLPADVRQRFLEGYKSRITNAGEVVIHSDEFRDQPKNIDACYEKLRQMVLAVLKPPKKRRATKPTRGSKVRRLNEKKARSDVKRGRQYRAE